jgi:hypothetical protein
VERGTSLGIVYSLSVDARDETVGVTPRCRVSAGTAALRPAAVSVKARDRQALYRRNAYAEVAAEEERASCIVATTTRLRCSS